MLSFKLLFGVTFTAIFAILVRLYWNNEAQGETKKVLNSTYDVIVVGAGSAGSVVASRLSENPNLKVLLLEEGGEDTDGSFRTPARMFEHGKTFATWKYQIEKQKHAHLTRTTEEEEKWVGGRVLGGGSSVNYMLYARGSRHDYDRWEELGCTGWSYKDVLPYFLKSEDVQDDTLGKTDYHSKGGFLGVSLKPKNILYQYFLNAGKELGFEEVDHNGKGEFGISSFQYTAKNGERSTPSIDLLRKAMLRENLHVSVMSRATRIMFQGKKASGVEFVKDGQKVSVGADKEVILSAGAIGSPRLMMLSGIGPATHLNELGIPVLADLPVGQNLQYHYLAPVWISTNRSDLNPQFPSTLDKIRYMALKSGKLASPSWPATIYARFDRKKTGRPDFMGILIDMKLPGVGFDIHNHKQLQENPGLTFILFISSPATRGFIKLRTRDPLDSPIIDPNYFSDKSEIEHCVNAIRFVEEMTRTSSFASLNASVDINRIMPCDDKTFDSDEYWACFLGHVIHGQHYSGTCKMGPLSDPNSVVDPQLKVKGLQGLRVIDSSIMPTLISSCNNAPAIMIGEKGADIILEDMKER